MPVCPYHVHAIWQILHMQGVLLHEKIGVSCDECSKSGDPRAKPKSILINQLLCKAQCCVYCSNITWVVVDKRQYDYLAFGIFNIGVDHLHEATPEWTFTWLKPASEAALPKNIQGYAWRIWYSWNVPWPVNVEILKYCICVNLE